MHTTSLLLFEDDDLDARLITSALAKAAPQIQVRRAHDGTSGLKIMEEDRPGMVLLDLSMPGLSGFQVLETIREDDILARTPVIICSNSDAQSDIDESYSRQANAYVTKPDSGAGYASLAEALAGFWIETVQLPS